MIDYIPQPETANKSVPRGASFLLKPTQANTIFIPEEFNEEQQLMAESLEQFLAQEIFPRIDEIDAYKDPELVPGLLEKAGELGFLSLSIPEEQGGLDIDFNTGLLIGEICAGGFSFATTIGAQTSIGSLPIVYYGTNEQKDKYLPKIGTGEWKAAYCLTEPDSGSDANSGKTKAVLNEEGTHYIINGQKMWITNGGFANIFIVFAKIDDDKNLSAFIIEKDFGGVSIGPEEKKLGIKGSSTVQVFFNDCTVPVENLLSDRGAGFKIALNILNTGRIKLAAGAVGGSKMAIGQATHYATERLQFGKAISEFGAIQHKLGEMAARTFACESAVYRTGKNIDLMTDALKEDGYSDSEAKLKAIREFAIECALLKVQASEHLAYTVDEALQIHGGMGYAVETGIERGYRDARITRIYEGTNEINRMLSVGELFKRAFKTKEVDLAGAMKKLPKELTFGALPFNFDGDRFAEEKKHIQNLKNVFLLLAGRAGQKLKLKLVDEQEIIMNLSDILAEAYIVESAWLRVEKIVGDKNHNRKAGRAYRNMAKIYLYEAIQRVRKAGEDVILSFTSGVEKNMLLGLLSRLTTRYDINPKETRRKIATYMINEKPYDVQHLLNG